MTVEITMPIAAGFCGVLTALLGGAFYLGDSRWLKKTEDDKTHQEFKTKVETLERDLSAKLSGLSNDITRHDTLLKEGEKTMARLEGMISAQNSTLGSIQAAVGRIEGKIKL